MGRSHGGSFKSTEEVCCPKMVNEVRVIIESVGNNDNYATRSNQRLTLYRSPPHFSGVFFYKYARIDSDQGMWKLACE